MFRWFSPFIHTSVIVVDRGPRHTQTGLIGTNGQPIYRIEYPEPIGFIHFPDPEDSYEEAENKEAKKG